MSEDLKSRMARLRAALGQTPTLTHPTPLVPPVPASPPPKLHLVVSPPLPEGLVDEEDEEDPLDDPDLEEEDEEEAPPSVPHLYEAKSYLLRGFGERFDCGHYNTCLTLFKGGGNAHCPVKCPHLCPPVKERATDFMRTRD